ncbi:MAG TPA: Rossmann-like and DUF2520 domain-containing protein [Candidatus Obscuribacterales bacterium]
MSFIVENSQVVIIGPGKVGTTLAVKARRSGLNVVAIGGRDKSKCEQAARAAGNEVQALTIVEAARLGDLTLLAVSDDAIGAVCAEIAQAKAFKRESLVAHLSGALSSEVLLSAKELCGANIVSAHPLKTFADARAAAGDKESVFWFVEGDAQAVADVSSFIEKLGGKPYAIARDGKALYHSASVVACNYFVTLMDVALQLMCRAGVDEGIAWMALRPLVKGTLDNIDALGPPSALTGPIARGDVRTVKRHMEAIRRSRPEAIPIYATLGKETVNLALRKGTIDEARAAEIKRGLAFDE